MWKIKFIQDTEIDGIGTLVATNGEVTLRRRVHTSNPAQVDRFVTDAKKLAAKADTDTQTVSQIEASILAQLNPI